MKHLSLALTLALALGGYPFMASVLSLAGFTDSSTPSIIFRIVLSAMVFFTLLLNSDGIRVRHNPIFIIAFLVFWIGYLLRILADGFFYETAFSPHVTPNEILASVFLFVLIPSLAGFVRLEPTTTKITQALFYVLTLVTAVLLLIEARDAIEDLIARTNIRFALERLNPITIGYVGGTLVVLSAINLYKRLTRFHIIRTVFFAASLLIGLFLVLLSASKGPAIATITCLVAYWLVPVRFPRLIAGAIVLFAIGIALTQTYNFIFKQFDLDQAERFVEAVEGESEGSVDARKIAFSGAIQQFYRSPVFGDALFEESTGFYPHNLPIEAFLATGILGGIAYLACLYFAAISILKLLYREDGNEWLALLALFFIIAAQFSGSHFSFGATWITLIAVITTSRSLQFNSSRKKRRRRRKVYYKKEPHIDEAQSV